MILWVLLLVLGVLAGCGRIPVATDPDAEVPGGRLAFIGGGEEFNFQLYVMWSDGSGLKTVPDVDPRSDFSGQSWSPDGRRLVFASNLGGNANFDIYTMDLEGGETDTGCGGFGGRFCTQLVSKWATDCLSSQTVDCNWVGYLCGQCRWLK